MAVPTVTPSTLVDTETLASESQVWNLADAPAANWATSITVRSSFEVAVTTNQDDTEQRRLLLDRQRHSVEGSWYLGGVDGARSAVAALTRAGVAGRLAPLLSDAGVLDGITDASTLVLDTRYRRLFAGARVLVVDRADRSSFHITTIASLTRGAAGPVVLTNAMPFYSAGLNPKRVAIYPLIEASISLQHELVLYAPSLARYDMLAIDTPGPHGLSLFGEPGDETACSLLNVANTTPIFPHGLVDWNEPPVVSFSRTGELNPLGRTVVPSVYGDYPRMSFRFVSRCLSREQAWKIRQIWEYAGGRTYTFFFPTPFMSFEFSSFPGAATISVVANGPELDWDFVKYLAISTRDCEQEVRRVVSVARVGSVDTVTLDAAFTIAAADIWKLTDCRLVRFASDELTERWTTTDCCDYEIHLLEVPNTNESPDPGDGGGGGPGPDDDDDGITIDPAGGIPDDADDTLGGWDID